MTPGKQKSTQGQQVQMTPEQARKAALDRQAECDRAVQSKKPPDGWQKSQERISALAAQMKNTFVERFDAVDAILAALISRAGCVLLGPPGTAKSLLVREVARACELVTSGDSANYFEYLLTPHTMPEEIFGPTDIGLLLQAPPSVQRRTLGRLPYAELAFLDEVFRGGSHILNTLLTILNERKFHNGQNTEDVPLIGFIGAANLPPQADEFKAFFDRFPVRIWVDTVLSGAQPVENATRLLESHRRTSLPLQDAKERPSMQDFRVLNAVLRIKVGMPVAGDDRLKEFTSNFRSFQSVGQLSDRAFVQLWYFAAALDMLKGKDREHSGYAKDGRGHYECFRFVAPNQAARKDVDYAVRQLQLRAGVTGS